MIQPFFNPTSRPGPIIQHSKQVGPSIHTYLIIPVKAQHFDNNTTVLLPSSIEPSRIDVFATETTPHVAPFTASFDQIDLISSSLSAFARQFHILFVLTSFYSTSIIINHDKEM